LGGGDGGCPTGGAGGAAGGAGAADGGGRIGGAGARGGAIGFTVGAGVCGGSGVISPNGIGRISAVRVHIGSGTCAAPSTPEAVPIKAVITAHAVGIRRLSIAVTRAPNLWLCAKSQVVIQGYTQLRYSSLQTPDGVCCCRWVSVELPPST
jgi:hypothetical protein